MALFFFFLGGIADDARTCRGVEEYPRRHQKATSPIWVRRPDLSHGTLPSPRLQLLAILQLSGERQCRGWCTLLTTMRPSGQRWNVV